MQFFKELAPIYRQNGFNVIPTTHKDKNGKGSFSQPGGKPQEHHHWVPDEQFAKYLKSSPDHDISLKCGGKNKIIAIDIDYAGRAKEELYETFLDYLPTKYIGKKGTKGFTMLFQYDGDKPPLQKVVNPYGSIETHDYTVVDFLFTKNVCVLPPSVSAKDNSISYEWVTDWTCENTSFDQLDFVNADDILELQAFWLEFQDKYFTESETHSKAPQANGKAKNKNENSREDRIFRKIWSMLHRSACDDVEHLVDSVLAYDKRKHGVNAWFETDESRAGRDVREFAKYKVERDVKKFIEQHGKIIWKKYLNISAFTFSQFFKNNNYQYIYYDEIEEKTFIEYEKLADDLQKSNCYFSTDGSQYAFNGMVWELVAEKDLESKVWKLLGDCKSHTKNEFLNRLKSRNYKKIDSFKKIPEHCFPVNNGILNAQTLELTQFTSEYFFTNMSVADYDKNATCPLFEKYLDDISINNPQLKDDLIKLLGYVIFDRHNPQQICFYLVGDGNNGKSVYANVLTGLLSAESYSGLDWHDADVQFKGIQLKDVILNLKDEPLRVIKNPEKAKQLITNGEITDSFKGADNVKFKVNCKFVLTANHLPKPNGDDSNGFYRRIYAMQFDRIFTSDEIQPDLSRRIIANELSGILNLAVYGYRKLLAGEVFKMSSVTEEFLHEVREANDPIYAFVSECTQHRDGFMTTSTDVYDAYDSYCRNVLKLNMPATRKAFESRLKPHLRKLYGSAVLQQRIWDSELDGRITVWEGLFITIPVEQKFQQFGAGSPELRRYKTYGRKITRLDIE